MIHADQGLDYYYYATAGGAKLWVCLTLPFVWLHRIPRLGQTCPKPFPSRFMPLSEPPSLADALNYRSGRSISPVCKSANLSSISSSPTLPARVSSRIVSSTISIHNSIQYLVNLLSFPFTGPISCRSRNSIPCCSTGRADDRSKLTLDVLGYNHFATAYTSLPVAGDCAGSESAALLGCGLLTFYLFLFIG